MISLVEQMAEVQRELARRKQGDPQGSRSHPRDAGQATYQIAALEAVLRTLALVDAAQRHLFPHGAAACPSCGRLGHGAPCDPCCGA